MKIVLISTIRNEADILETFARHHEQIVDRMIIVNHRSADDSGRILSAMQSEGIPLDIHHEQGLDLQQGGILTRCMKDALQDEDAAWFLPLDADEFITASAGKPVKEVIAGLPTDRVIKIPWKTYVPVPSDDAAELNVLKRVQHRRQVEHPIHYKILIPRKLAERKDALIAPGNHALVKNAIGKKKENPFIITDQLALAHFPVRSAEQVMTKAFVGWLACLSKPNKEATEAHHLKKLYDRFKTGDVVTVEELRTLAVQYASDIPASEQQLVHDPVMPASENFELRHTTGYGCRPVAVLAEMAENFASELAAMRRHSRSGNLSLKEKMKRFLARGKGYSWV